MASRLYRLGEVVTDTPGDIKLLSSVAGTTANRFQAFKVNGSNYQVTAGKTLYMAHWYYTPASSGDYWQLHYGDTAVDDSASAPTNDVTMTTRIYEVTALDLQEFKFIAAIPAAKYPTYHAVTGGSPFIICNALEV